MEERNNLQKFCSLIKTTVKEVAEEIIVIGTTDECMNLRRIAKSTCVRNDRELMNEKLRVVQYHRDTKNARKFYEIIRKTRDTYQPRDLICKEHNHN